MTPLFRALPLLAALLLPACYLSSTPHIETGVLLSDGNAVFCSPDDGDCQTGRIDGDGYLVKSDDGDEEDMRLRFEPLVMAGGVQVYVAEAELREQHEAAWAYLVARRNGDSDDGLPRFDVMMPGCNDFDEATRARYAIARTDSYTCGFSDYAAFRQFLSDNYAARFADDAWWADET